MALTDRTRGRWVLSLLTVRATDAVLEVGFGPGTDLRRMSARVPQGFLAGVEASPVMLRQAARRNAVAIRAGRMRLVHAAMPGPLPFADATFDLVYSINSVLFWSDRAAALAELRRVLKPDGRIALAMQPMWRGATAETAQQTGKALGEALIHAGFREVRVELHALRPTPVACALGTRDDDATFAE
jgi:ubiquinone/menaquinone biosynthesis C-methylase UbiE